MSDYALILSVNYVGKEWTMLGNSYENLTWLDSSPKPTLAELDALWPATQIIVANKQAETNRHNAYVTESDPLFFKAQRGEVTMEEWQVKVDEIKARYPKV